MSDKNDKRFMPNADPEAYAATGQFVSASINHVIQQDDIMGSILGSAMEMTGSDGKMFQDAIAHFSSILDPLTLGLADIMKNPETMHKIRKKLLMNRASIEAARRSRREENN